ncbi:MAG TPA: zf-HC2 domain-containing protein [Vicinamibacterales bacterium]|nr:zf-HC2 domain-containing protein [Vicinamibacterales bacterium]
MNTCDQVRPQLSGYVDRHLDAALAGDVRAHLLSCDACRGIADDLGLLRDAARTLGPIDPPPHVWLEIAGRVRLDGGTRDTAAPIRAVAAPAGRSRTDQWQWLGLAAALLLTTLAVYSIATPDSPAPVAVTSNANGNAAEVPTVETFEDTMKRAEAEYESAIAQLEQLAKSGDPRVSAAATTLQQNVTKIDSAIAETRAALKDSPDSQPARTSLFEALRNKVNLLQHTVVLMNEMRKGDAGGAAEAAAGLGKGDL